MLKKKEEMQQVKELWRVHVRQGRRGGGEEHWASEKHLMTSRKRQCEGACDLWVFRSTNTVRDRSRNSYAFTLCSQSKHVHLPQAGTQLTAKCCLSLCWHLSPKLMWLDVVPLFCTISSALFVYQASSTNHVPFAVWKWKAVGNTQQTPWPVIHDEDL